MLKNAGKGSHPRCNGWWGDAIAAFEDSFETVVTKRLHVLMYARYCGGILHCTSSGTIPLSNYYNKEYSILSWAEQMGNLTDDALPLVHSVSYGNDEKQQTSTAYMLAVNVAIQKLGVRGRTVLFASGDGGVAGRSCNNKR